MCRSFGPGLSSLIIIACIGAVIGSITSSLQDAVSSLSSVSSQFRVASAREANDAIAEAIRPNWQATRAWADLMRGGVAHATPMRETMLDYSLLEEHLALTRYPDTNLDAHLERYAPGAHNRTYAGFVGMVAVLTDTTWEAERAASLAVPPQTTCTSSWTSGFLRLPVPGPPTYIIDRNVANTSVPNQPGGTAGYSRQFHPYVPSLPPGARIINPSPIVTPPPLNCPFLMAPFWSPFASPMDPNFENFSWFGPYNPGIGWGNQFEGSVPIYDSSPARNIVGRASSAVALASITDSLMRIFEQSVMFKNAIAAVYTPNMPNPIDVATGGNCGPNPCGPNPFANLLIAQTLVPIEGLANLVTIRYTPNGFEAFAPVEAPVPPGPFECTHCITECIQSPAFCIPKGSPADVCPPDACSVQAMEALCAGAPLTIEPTPQGPSFVCSLSARMSSLADAIAAVEDAAGESCPTERLELDGESSSQLIDVTPFLTEEYGLPQLAPPGRWCVLIVLPRSNVFAATDRANRNVLVVLVVSLTGIVLGGVLLIVALWIVNHSRRLLTRERRQLDEHRVHEAVAKTKLLSHPMILVPAEVFVGLGRLVMHEKLREDLVPLLTVNSLAELNELRKTRRVIFISHQVSAAGSPRYAPCQRPVARGSPAPTGKPGLAH